MPRSEHEFQFPASAIAEAAGREAEYHEGRLLYWRTLFRDMLAIVEASVSAKVIQTEVTGGVRVQVAVDYGDREAWSNLQLAEMKIDIHRDSAERYRSDEELYRSQGDRVYELSGSDVAYFRIAGGEREE